MQGKTLASVLNGYACAEDSEPLCNTDAYVDCVDLVELATGQKGAPLDKGQRFGFLRSVKSCVHITCADCSMFRLIGCLQAILQSMFNMYLSVFLSFRPPESGTLQDP